MKTAVGPAGELPRFQRLSGVVAEFDEPAGWGVLRTDAGHAVFFHCTQIADGTRTVPVGVAVEADAAPIGLGGWEATRVRRIGR